MKKIGFPRSSLVAVARLADGHRRAALQQSVDLAVAPAGLGADCAYFGVHHFKING